MNLSPLAVGLIVAAFTALLVGLGWLITSQIQTNKSLSKGITDVVSEFKVAMSLIEERSNNQKTLCQLYRDQINSRQKDMNTELAGIKRKFESFHQT